MTRRIVYGISLWVYLGAVACTLAALLLPNWISFTAPTPDDPIHVTLGLHQRCSSITGKCTPFPADTDCRADVPEERGFCGVWRSTAFFMNFAVVMELACGVAYVVILAGGRGIREGGWKMLSGLLGTVVAAQIVAMALVAYAFDHSGRFFTGYYLDKSWVLCIVSWVVLLVNAVSVVSAAFFLPPEDDYEPILDSH